MSFSAHRRARGGLLAGALLGATALTSPSLAQAQAQAPASAETTTSETATAGLEEVVVTARRRAENAQTVPIAISAFSGTELEERRSYNVRDLQQLTPSLVVTVTNPRNTSINIRGLGNNVSVYNDGLQPAVGVYLDQVYLGRPAQAVFDLADVESVQVLRGPQGTLFGKNTSAGAVVVSTKTPSFMTEAAADVSVGNYGYLQGHATVGGALVGDKIAARLSLAGTKRGGYMTNTFDGSRTQTYSDFGGRLQLLFTPSETFQVRVTGDYGQQFSNTSATVLTGLLTNYADDGTAYPNGYLARAARIGFTPLPIDPEARLVSTNTKNNYFEHHGGLSAIADWTLPGHTLTSVTAWRYWNWYPHNDADGTTRSAAIDFHQSNEQDQFSQELRLTSTGDRRLEYVVGAYYFWQDVNAEAVSYYGPAGADWFLAPTAGSAAVRSAALDNYSIVSDSSPVTKSVAAFGQGVLHLTDRLELTGGLRYTWEKISGFFDQRASGADISGLSAADQAAVRTLRARFGVANRFDPSFSDGALTGSVSLAYTVRDDLLAYGSWARGYKAGGINLSNINTAGANAVDPIVGPETLDAWEVGLKSSWFDKRLTANLALYWTVDDNYQTTQVNLINNISSLTNAGKVRTRGAELDLRAAPAEGLTLYGSVAYNDASYLEYAQAACPIEIRLRTVCDLGGQRLPGVSKWAVSLGGQYAAPLSQSLEGYVGADYSYRTDFFTSASNSLYSLIAAYGLVNLRAGVRSGDGRWDLQAWVRNADDKLYFLSLGAANTGAVTGTLGDPRTYGVTLRARL
jgi:iron complex outermembrane receptor protein